MVQPFEPFKQVYVNRLLQLKHFWLVSQSYPRAINPFQQVQRTNILFTDYDDPGLAKIHLNAVKTDVFAALIDLRKSFHAATIERMLQPGSEYTVYWSIVKNMEVFERRLNDKFKDHMRRYIAKNTQWRISADESIRPRFEVTFGELFIILKRGTQRLRVKFEEIEAA